jgi:hypothetical protein
MVISVTGSLYNCYVYFLVSVLRAADCYSEYEDWMHNMVFFVDSTNIEKSQIYSHILMLRGWMVLICLHMSLG